MQESTLMILSDYAFSIATEDYTNKKTTRDDWALMLAQEVLDSCDPSKNTGMAVPTTRLVCVAEYILNHGRYAVVPYNDESTHGKARTEEVHDAIILKDGLSQFCVFRKEYGLYALTALHNVHRFEKQGFYLALETVGADLERFENHTKLLKYTYHVNTDYVQMPSSEEYRDCMEYSARISEAAHTVHTNVLEALNKSGVNILPGVSNKHVGGSNVMLWRFYSAYAYYVACREPFRVAGLGDLGADLVAAVKGLPVLEYKLLPHKPAFLGGAQ